MHHTFKNSVDRMALELSALSCVVDHVKEPNKLLFRLFYVIIYRLNGIIKQNIILLGHEFQ